MLIQRNYKKKNKLQSSLLAFILSKWSVHMPNPLVKNGWVISWHTSSDSSSSAYITPPPPTHLPPPPVRSLLLSSVVSEELQKGQTGQSQKSRHQNHQDEVWLRCCHNLYSTVLNENRYCSKRHCRLLPEANKSIGAVLTQKPCEFTFKKQMNKCEANLSRSF